MLFSAECWFLTIISLRTSPVVNKVLCLTCVLQWYHSKTMIRMCKSFRKVMHRLSSIGNCPPVFCLFILWCFSYWCFWTVVLEKTLESPLDSKEINQSILKEINLGCSFKGQMLKLKLQCFSHLMRRANWLKKTLMLEKIEGREKKVRQKMRWLDNITESMDVILSKLRQIVKDREAWRAANHGDLKRHDWVTEQQQQNYVSF